MNANALSDKTLYCSRVVRYKGEADRIAKWFREHGGTSVTVTGRRGIAWSVRARMPITEFAKFCSEEARQELAKR